MHPQHWSLRPWNTIICMVSWNTGHHFRMNNMTAQWIYTWYRPWNFHGIPIGILCMDNYAYRFCVLSLVCECVPILRTNLFSLGWCSVCIYIYIYICISARRTATASWRTASSRGAPSGGPSPSVRLLAVYVYVCVYVLYIYIYIYYIYLLYIYIYIYIHIHIHIHGTYIYIYIYIIPIWEAA